MIEEIKKIIIASKKSHSMDFPYVDKDGIKRRLNLNPGDNEVEKEVWATVKKDYKDRSPFYFKGLIEKGEKK